MEFHSKFIIVPLYIFVILTLTNPVTTVGANTPLTLKVGYYEDSPLIFTDNEGNAAGIYADILNYIVQEEKWTIEWEYGTWNECLSKLKNNEIDIMTAIAFSEERNLIYDFSNETVLANWGIIYSSPNIKVESILDLDGKTIAVLPNDIYYEGPDGIKNLIERFDINSTFIEVDSYADVLSQIDAGKVDTGVVTRLYGSLNDWNYDVKKTPIIFSPIELRFAFPKDASLNPYLIEQIDTQLKILKADKESVYYKSIEKHLSSEVPLLVFPKWIMYFFSGIFGILLIFMFYNFLLRKQVKKKTEEILEKDEEIRMMFKSSPDAITLIDLNGTIIACNNATVLVHGFSDKEELIGKNAFDLFAQKEISRVRKGMEELLEKGSVRDAHYQLLKKDGNTFPAEISAAVIRDQKGNPRYLMSITKDISERNKLLNSIRKAQKEAEFYSDVLLHDIAN
ncbi:MAG: PAS domain S-box protein, partial [Candidatus Heimdallarchaeaceae archaeon]